MGEVNNNNDYNSVNDDIYNANKMDNAGMTNGKNDV